MISSNQLEVVGINCLTRILEKKRIAALDHTRHQYNAQIAQDKIDLLSVVQIPPFHPGSEIVFALSHIQHVTQERVFSFKNCIKFQFKVFAITNLILLPIMVFLPPKLAMKTLVISQAFFQLASLIYSLAISVLDGYCRISFVKLDMKPHILVEDMECAISLENLKIDPETRSIKIIELTGHLAFSKIAHVFHAKCLKKMIQVSIKNERFFKCPVCMQFILDNKKFLTERPYFVPEGAIEEV